MLALIYSFGLGGGHVQLGDAARNPEQRAPLRGVALLRNPEQRNPEQPALAPSSNISISSSTSQPRAAQWQEHAARAPNSGAGRAAAPKCQRCSAPEQRCSGPEHCCIGSRAAGREHLSRLQGLRCGTCSDAALTDVDQTHALECAVSRLTKSGGCKSDVTFPIFDTSGQQ